MCRFTVSPSPHSMRVGGAIGFAMPMIGLWSKWACGSPPAFADSAKPRYRRGLPGPSSSRAAASSSSAARSTASCGASVLAIRSMTSRPASASRFISARRGDRSSADDVHLDTTFPYGFSAIAWNLDRARAVLPGRRQASRPSYGRAMGDDALSFLHDVVVLDLGDEATALAGEYLAELGATVVRIEDQGGDVLRRRGGLWHAVHNAGKQSVAIDTSSDSAWDGLAAVLNGVDVVIGPLEPNAATERFLDRLRADGDGRIGLVDVVFRRDGPRP